MDATRLGPSMSNAIVALINRSRTPDENASSPERLTKSSISGRERCAAKLDEEHHSLLYYGGESVGPLWEITYSIEAPQTLADFWLRPATACQGSRRLARVAEQLFVRSRDAKTRSMRIPGNACLSSRIAKRSVRLSTGLLCDWLHAPKRNLSNRRRAAIGLKPVQHCRVDADRHAVAQTQIP